MLFEKHLEDAKDPKWGGRFGCHNWRDYIADEIQKNWENLSLEVRCAVIEQCQDIADKEEWD
jgi:hypothetical protein